MRLRTNVVIEGIYLNDVIVVWISHDKGKNAFICHKSLICCGYSLTGFLRTPFGPRPIINLGLMLTHRK